MKAHVQKPDFVFRAKRTTPFKSAGGVISVKYWSRVVRISGNNAGYNMFRGSVKGTGYPLHSPGSPSLPLPCVTVCHQISTGVYTITFFYTVVLPLEKEGVNRKRRKSKLMEYVGVSVTKSSQTKDVKPKM